MRIEELPTPCLVVEEPLLMENLAIMNRAVQNSPALLRPHYKTHKCPRLAQLQIALGAKGMCCAKLSEAEDLADAGIADILIANQVVQPMKVRQLARLARRCHLTVCVDNEENIDALSAAAKEAGSTIHLYVELDSGMNRCGVFTYEDVLRLAKYIETKAHLAFDGIQCYAGHLSHEAEEGVRVEESQALETKLYGLVDYLKENGVTVKEISGCSSGTALLKQEKTVYTELQAGSYVYMDASYNHLSLPFYNALTILGTVISVTPYAVVTDMGMKACAVDQGMPVYLGYPEDAEVRLSEEHGTIDGQYPDARINDKIRMIPGHCCTTVNLYDALYLVRDGVVLEKWAITSRGKSQ
ncbi:DSD1 family PLP-dependent enzyme [Eubacteriales bacterium OttesenSCG-928-M02]|nr:DSD1 family PLP-dependent enzyme [Eubacteriales bacterium OttesenSCG-928-M02]